MLTIGQIQKVTKGVLLQGNPSQKVQGVSIDSKKIKLGYLFIAVKGERLDAHRFIPEAIRKKSSAIIVSKNVSVPKHVAVIRVKNTTKALGHVASLHRRAFNIPVIAVTGSAGKTTTKDMIASVLDTKYNVLKNEKTQNNQFGVPLTLLKLKKSHQILVIELGTNQFGDIRWLTTITYPTIAVFTNVGESHLKGLKNKSGVFREKFSLVKYMDPKGVVIFNSDDLYLKNISLMKISQKKVTYAINHTAHYRAKVVQRNGNRHIDFKVGKKTYMIGSPSYHNIYNALAAICCGSAFKIGYNNININIRRFRFKEGRAQILRFGKITVINDTYNSNPLSLASAVETLEALRVRGSKFLVCGDMLELGSQSKQLHWRMGEQIAQKNIDYCFTFGKDAKYISQRIRTTGLNVATFHGRSINDIHQQLKRLSQEGDVILVKGSRGMGMEKTIAFLKKQYS